MAAIRDNKALEAATVIAEYCKSKGSCQNCIFRKHGGESWRCQIQAMDLQDVVSNIKAKKG